MTIFYNVITTCEHGHDDELIQKGKKLDPDQAARFIAEQDIEKGATD